MVVDNWSEIKAVTIAVAAGIAARFVPALVVATYQLGQTAIFALRAQVGLFSFARTAGATTGVLALLGGPAGLGMLAAQLVVAGGAYYLMTQQTKDTTEALSDQGLTVDELKEKYKKLNAEQLKIKSLDVADAISKQKRLLKKHTLNLIAVCITFSLVQEQRSRLVHYSNILMILKLVGIEQHKH